MDMDSFVDFLVPRNAGNEFCQNPQFVGDDVNSSAKTPDYRTLSASCCTLLNKIVQVHHSASPLLQVLT